MNLHQLINAITPAIYENLKRAVELGKWPDGNKITAEQRELCMQAVIAYEHKYLSPNLHTGYIPPKPHTYCASDHEHDSDQQQDNPLRWVE